MLDAQGPGGDDGGVPSQMVAELRHGRRRQAVETLIDQSGQLSLVALASELAADSDDTLPDVVVELHDVHLPAMQDCGLVAYDADTGAVTCDAAVDVIETALDRAADADADES